MSRVDDPGDEPPEHQRSLLERLRGTGVGTEDPNIVGDAGPTDVAPGGDPDLPVLTEPLPPEEETPSEQLLPSDDGPAAEGLSVELVEEVVIVDDVGIVEVVEAVVFPSPEEG